MQCPDCGYGVDDAAIFCPQCRFQFRDILEEPAWAADTVIDLPERGVIAEQTIPEESRPQEQKKAFTARELRMLEVHLLQPASVIVLTISLVTYTVISAVPFVPVIIAGLHFGITGIICLACGLACGIVFFLGVRGSLVRFRYQ